MKKICGISHPVPTKFAKRIYNENKTVFVSKRCLCQVSVGDKFVLYESGGAKAYTGWADIKSIGKKDLHFIIKDYGGKLMVTPEEFGEYAKGNKEMNVIEFENFEKFKTPVIPKRFVTVAGKYIYEDEFKFIDENRG